MSPRSNSYYWIFFYLWYKYFSKKKRCWWKNGYRIKKLYTVFRRYGYKLLLKWNKKFIGFFFFFFKFIPNIYSFTQKKNHVFCTLQCSNYSYFSMENIKFIFDCKYINKIIYLCLDILIIHTKNTKLQEKNKKKPMINKKKISIV